MNNENQSVLGVATEAATSVMDVGVVGALLILSIIANVALVYAVIRAYRSKLSISEE